MRELVIISGKGGTGKTSLTAAFASLAENMLLCDADVDAADLHLLMNPTIQERYDFQAGNQAIIDPSLCCECGICHDLCHFDAISTDYQVDRLSCEGCGVCVDFCPVKAIDFPIKTCGEWFVSDTRFGPMVHARLGIAEENSGRLVSLIREESKKRAQDSKSSMIITDGPPGIGCPVISSITGATAVVIVAEPSVSGVHDMERVVELATNFRIPVMICVNKYDLNLKQTLAIENFARDKEIRFLGKISYNPVFTKAMIQGETIFEYKPDADVCQVVSEIWDSIITGPEVNNVSHLEFSFT
ncbi:MAG: 4Fe-4S binding protein [Deltaproteobacteria bacterium]|nr:4Fe-4S binding protein [Deltaproteobacteria bacterium]MBT4091143.1 4Fe-4S binding protein [Deltaproteobacteria bacterium]MBT4268979.1 4Fe-4S binding protein [Deltaproteobacteria bacterium]MBT4641626.1 4Fe-4S binding protein [Deltaproteobacteria bacterium]MBT6503080.1 4Fe-4S binding protein [Deltaproteobacteria bacterium]